MNVMNVKNNRLYAVVNRNGKALLVGANNKYVEFNGESTAKAGMLAIAKVLELLADIADDYNTATILLPKNLFYLLKRDTVYEWVNNGNKAKSGTILDDEYVELAKYIVDMKAWLGSKIKFKLTGTRIVSAEEHNFMKSAWDLLDKVTGYKTVMVNRPVRPSFLEK